MLIKEVKKFKTQQVIDVSDHLEDRETVLYMVTSHDESLIALCYGYTTIGDDVKVTKIIILECTEDRGYVGIEYEFQRKIDIDLEDTCK